MPDKKQTAPAPEVEEDEEEVYVEGEVVDDLEGQEGKLRDPAYSGAGPLCCGGGCTLSTHTKSGGTGL